jgi:predicted ATPase/class 3 adenylate cyclase
VLSVDGFDRLELVSEGRAFTVYRARRLADGAECALKCVAAADPDGALAAQLHREYTLGAAVDPEFLARALAVLETPQGPVLVREFRGLRTLAAIIADGPCDPMAACVLGAAVCRALAAVHRAGIVHRDVKPSNVLVDARGTHAWLTDLGIAARMVGGRCPADPERVEGTFAYMAPEQSGRTQRAVVPASDLYALGVVLYELLAGSVPFSATSALGWFQAHLALAPPDLRARRPDVPAPLAAVVHRLLAKDPDARYQSAAGVARDLDRCADAIARGDDLRGFVPGGDDRPERFHRPDVVIGRDGLLAQIADAYTRVEAGGFAVLRLRGEAGAGKSALVGALRGRVAAAMSLFVEGKHDTLQRNVPYAALLAALRRALRVALSDEPAAREAWRARVGDALRPNAAALGRMVPELAALLGPLPAAPPLGPAESEVRFQLALRGLVAALPAPERPATLFLDDLQWADEATLRAVAGIVARAPAGLLLVTAERDDEPDPGELRAALWRELGTSVTTLAVGALDREGVAALVARVFPADDAQVAALADVVRARTRGNPFAAVEFLGALADAGLARFDADARRWSVDASAAAASPLPDTAVALVARRMDGLDGDTRQTLGAAAAVGGPFDTALLAAVRARPAADIDAQLAAAAAEGLVRQVAAHDGLGWRFAHDRVEEAAFAALPSGRRAETHARIARCLAARWGEDLDAPRLFAVAHQYALGRDALDADDVAAPSLARRAGELAREAGAWRAALGHFELAAARLPGGGDLELQLSRAECAYLGTDFDALDGAAAAAHARAASPTDHARVDEVLVRALNHRGEHAQAVALALRALETLGHTFPAKPAPPHILAGLAITRARLGRRRPEDLDALPMLTDPAQAAALRLMVSASSSAFFVSPTLFPLLALRVVQVTLAHGASALAPFGYAAYGLLLAVHFGQLDRGYRFGELARRAAARDEASAALRGQVEFLFNYWIRHWQAPLALCAADMTAAAAIALERGGLEYWSYNLTGGAATDLLRGAPLDPLDLRVRRDAAALRELRQQKTLVFAVAMRAVLADLRGDAARDALLAETARGLDGYRASGDVNGVANLCMLDAFRLALTDRPSEALAAAEEAERHIEVLAGQVYLPALRFAHALALADALPTLPPLRRAAGHLKLRQLVGAFEGWARRSPESYGRRAALLAAELCRAEGRAKDASAGYDAAIARCDAEASEGDAALIYLRAARFHDAQGHAVIARSLAAEARVRCVRWGAVRLARDLTAHFDLADAPVRSVRPAAPTTSTLLGSVDFTSSLKAARAISEEIELDPLQRKLVAVVIENAGARRGALLSLRDGALTVVAEGAAGAEVTLGSVALDAHPALPRRVIRYVAQTGETVLLHDASRSAEFGGDPGLRGARSVLCVALARQGAVTGVVYLEHDDAAGAFTPERAEVVRVLAAQAAVSLENARLYADLAGALRRQISLTEANARFVPAEFLSALGRGGIDEVALGDSVQREMTVLFSDMRGFTRHVEGMSPVENISFINGYLSAMEPAILGRGGFVDSYIGDAIMALFAVPPAEAVAAGVEMHRRLRPINAARAAAGQRTIRIGVGLNTGELTLGTIGGPQRIKCGVIGDCVNLAARIESLTKRYGAGLIVGERTHALLPPEAFLTRELDRVRVVGRLAPVTLYEVLDADDDVLRDAKRDALSEWATAVQSWRAGDVAEAAVHFRRCRDAAPDDAAAALRLARCERALREGPTAPWSDVEDLLEK